MDNKTNSTAFESAVTRALERNIEHFSEAEAAKIKSELVELRNNPNKLPDDEAMVLMGRAYMYDILERVSESILADREQVKDTFLHSSAAKDDPRLAKLIAEMGMEGYGIYWCLIEELNKLPDNACKLGDIRTLAVKFKTEPEKVAKVVNNYMLFTIEGGSETTTEAGMGDKETQELRKQFAQSFRSAMQGLTTEERLQVYEALADYTIAGIEPNMEQMHNNARMAWVLTTPYLAPATHTPYNGQR